VRRAVKPLLGVGLALAGLAMHRVHPALAVGVTFVAVVAALPMDFNVPLGRMATYAALLCHAAAIYLGSGSLLLAAVPLPFALWMPPYELALKHPRLLAWSPVIGLSSSAALFALAWPTGSWGFAVAPWLLGLLAVSRWLAAAKAERALDARPKLPKVGQPMPPLRLPRRDDGEAFDLAAQRGRFTLLCFLRGDWCPLCHVMMRFFRKEARRLAEHNVQLVAVSPESGPAANEFARDLGIDYTMLVDEHAATARLWGILDLGERKGDPVPMPVCMLVDPGGVLRFLSRPDDLSAFVGETKVLALVEAHAVKAE
jgi:peroxiredoxin